MRRTARPCPGWRCCQLELPNPPVAMPPWIPKQPLGRLLFRAASRFPVLRPALCRWGLRTQRQWFAGCVAEAVSRQDGHRLKLASFAENYLSFELFWRGLDYYEPLTTCLAEHLTATTSLFVDAGA